MNITSNQKSAEQRDYSESTIIAPTFNEEDNISIFIDKMNYLYPKINIIVADDGSKDRTQEVVREKSEKYSVFLLDRKRERLHGITISVIDALKITKTKFFVCMDSDLQHPLEIVGKIIEELERGVDFVIATREKVSEDWPVYRKISSKVACFMGKVRLAFSKFRNEDLMSGFFGGRLEFVKPYLLKKRRFEFRGYKILFDLIKQFPNSTRFKRVYYTFETRKHGSSKLNWKIILFYFFSLIK